MKMQWKSVRVVLVRYFKYCTKCTHNFQSPQIHIQPISNRFIIIFTSNRKITVHTISGVTGARFPLCIRWWSAHSQREYSVSVFKFVCSWPFRAWTWSIVGTHLFRQNDEYWLILKRTSLSVESESDLTILLWEYEQGQCTQLSQACSSLPILRMLWNYSGAERIAHYSSVRRTHSQLNQV